MERRILGAFAAAVLTSAFASPAFAAYEPVLDQMRVKVGDLNLDNYGGAQVALNRIRTASQRFCTLDLGSRLLAQYSNARKCDARMTYLAVQKLDAPLVTAAYERSNAKPSILLTQR